MHPSENGDEGKGISPNQTSLSQASLSPPASSLAVHTEEPHTHTPTHTRPCGPTQGHGTQGETLHATGHQQKLLTEHRCCLAAPSDSFQLDVLSNQL